MTSSPGSSGHQARPGSANGGSEWSKLCTETFKPFVDEFGTRIISQQKMLDRLKACRDELARHPVNGMDRATAKQQLEAAFKAAHIQAMKKRSAADAQLCNTIAERVLQQDKAARNESWKNEPFQALARWFANSRIECRRDLLRGGLHAPTCESIVKAVLDNEYLWRFQEMCSSHRQSAKARLDAIVQAPKGDPTTTLRLEIEASISRVSAPKYVYNNKADSTNAEILKSLEEHKNLLHQDYLQARNMLLTRQPKQPRTMIPARSAGVQRVHNAPRGKVATGTPSSTTSQRSKKTGVKNLWQVLTG